TSDPSSRRSSKNTSKGVAASLATWRASSVLATAVTWKDGSSSRSFSASMWAKGMSSSASRIFMFAFLDLLDLYWQLDYKGRTPVNMAVFDVETPTLAFHQAFGYI